MKKLLLGAAAMVAFAAPAFAADMPARTYTKAPAYTAPEVVYNWTGFYIGGHHRRCVRGQQQPAGKRRPVPGRRAGWLRLPVRDQLGDRCRGPVQLAAGNNNRRAVSRAATLVTANTDQLGSVTGRLGYTWGPALLYAKGGYAWRDNNNIGVSSAACRWHLPPMAATGTAIPSVPASNTCSRRTGPPRPNTSITISATPPSPAGLPTIVGARFRDDEHTVKVGMNYRFGWGGPVAAKY